MANPFGVERRPIQMENSSSHESCMCWAQVLRMIMEAHGMKADHERIAEQLGRTLKNGIFLECVRAYLERAGFFFIERENQSWEELKTWAKIANAYGGHVAVEIWDKRDYHEVIEKLREKGVDLKPLPPDEHALIIKEFGKDEKGEFVVTYDPGYEREYPFRKDEWMSMWFKMTDETLPPPYLNEKTGENVTWRWMMVIWSYPEAPIDKEILDQGGEVKIFPEVEGYLRAIGEPVPE